MATFPCRNCVYFDTCGERNRTIPCDGRETKSDLKRKRKTESAEKRKASKQGAFYFTYKLAETNSNQ